MHSNRIRLLLLLLLLLYYAAIDAAMVKVRPDEV